MELLDFYHASQHVWALGEAVQGDREAAHDWVEKQLHQLRHGRQAAAWRTIAGLKTGRNQAGKVIRREQNYFAGQAGRMNYRAVAERGWPIGSGLVESACLQRQGRFKRSGQFWTPPGLRHLSALIEARAERSLGYSLESITGGTCVRYTRWRVAQVMLIYIDIVRQVML
jgi:hypothetical protein